MVVLGTNLRGLPEMGCLPRKHGVFVQQQCQGAAAAAHLGSCTLHAIKNTPQPASVPSLQCIVQREVTDCPQVAMVQANQASSARTSGVLLLMFVTCMHSVRVSRYPWADHTTGLLLQHSQ